MTLGERIRSIRHQRGMSKTAMAIRIGIPCATLKTWEDNENIPRADSLAQLCQALNVSADWMLGIERRDGIEAITAKLGEALAELQAMEEGAARD